MTIRSAVVGGCLALAMLTTAACVQLNEAINSRDLNCIEVPDDICTRIADDIARQWDPARAAQHGPIVKIRVQPIDCGVAFEFRRPEMARCWETQTATAVSADGSGGAGIGAMYYQTADGSLFDGDGVVVGN